MYFPFVYGCEQVKQLRQELRCVTSLLEQQAVSPSLVYRSVGILCALIFLANCRDKYLICLLHQHMNSGHLARLAVLVSKSFILRLFLIVRYVKKMFFYVTNFLP